MCNAYFEKMRITLFYIVWWICALGQVQGQHNLLTCSVFVDGDMSVLKLKLTKSTFSTCGQLPSTATCSFKPVYSSSIGTVCILDLMSCDTESTSRCRCTGVTKTQTIFHLGFRIQKKYTGGNFSCDTDCVIWQPEEVKPPIYIDQNCLNISVASYGGTLYCPEIVKKGKKVTLVFLLEESQFPSACSEGTDYLLRFEGSPDGTHSTYTTNCTVPDLSQARACHGSFTSGTLGCGCTKKNGTYVMEYNFMADDNYQRWWKAHIQCLNIRHAQELVFNETASCHNMAVAVNGNWTSRGSYGSCSQSCGGGTQERERNCTNPTPAHGGANCSGPSQEYRSCNTQPCPDGSRAVATIAVGITAVLMVLAAAIFIYNQRHQQTVPPASPPVTIVDNPSSTAPLPPPKDEPTETTEADVSTACLQTSNINNAPSAAPFPSSLDQPAQSSIDEEEPGITTDVDGSTQSFETSTNVESTISEE